MSGYLLTARILRAAAAVALLACVWLANVHAWLAFWLVLGLVPSLLVTAGRHRRAHYSREEGQA